MQFRVCLSNHASCLSAVQRSRRLSLQYHATRLPIAKAFQLLSRNSHQPLISFVLLTPELVNSEQHAPSATGLVDAPCSCNYCSYLSCSRHSGHWQPTAASGLRYYSSLLQHNRWPATAIVAGQQLFTIRDGNLCSQCKR